MTARRGKPTLREVVQGDLTWVDGAFRPNVRIEIDLSTGRLVSVGAAPSHVDRRMPGVAIAPGFISAHSHAFQRGLRGLGETFPEDAGSFWTWREAMYELVESLTPERAGAISRLAFEEMVRAGLTSVGEFHYVRHTGDSRGYELDHAVVEAAQDAGIRLLLMPAHYVSGGVGGPLSGAQRRFDTGSPDEYWRRFESLAHHVDGERQRLGACVHSVRAAPVEQIREIHEEARRRGLTFHMHLEEQRREIDVFEEAHAQSPLAWVNDHLDVDERMTIVHATHSDPVQTERYMQAGGRVCLCPLTEANLGDGVPDAAGMAIEDGRLCIGTDSNLRISPFEELRLLEYAQRLDGERRGVVLDEHGSCAQKLFEIGTRGGAEALGDDAGVIREGAFADLAAFDLHGAELSDVPAERLLDAIVFGAGVRALTEVCVGGEWTRTSGR